MRRTKMEENTIQPTSPFPSPSNVKNITSKKKSKSIDSPPPLPSTSSEKNKVANEKSKPTSSDSLPPLIALGTDGDDGVRKLIQLSPLSPYKKRLSTLKRVNLKNVKSIPFFESLKLEINAQALDGSKILHVKQKNLPKIKKIEFIADKFVRQPSEQAQQGNTASSTNTPVSSTTVSSITDANIPANQVSESTEGIPNILQKRASLYKVTPTKEITKTDSQASKAKDIRECSSSTSNESDMTKKKAKDIKECSSSTSNESNTTKKKAKDVKECSSSTSHENNTTNKKAKDIGECSPSTSHESNKKEEITNKKACKKQEVQSKSKDAKATTPEKNKKTEKENSLNEKSKSSKRKRKKSAKDDRDSPNDEAPSLYVAEGFREDVECLVEKCLQVSKLNIQKFTEIYQEMDFACVFHGRKSGAELAELSEELIHIAKSYFVAPDINLEENITGLLLVYALLNHQPFEGYAALRIVPEDVPIILNLRNKLKAEKRHDILYVLGHVLIKGPCEFTVLERELSLEPSIKKYYDGTVNVPTRMNTEIHRNGVCVQHLKEMAKSDRRMQHLQERMRAMHGGRDVISNSALRPAESLVTLYHEHLPHRMLSNQDRKQQMQEANSTSKQTPEDKRADILRLIKERAMTNVVDPVKHLTGLNERKQVPATASGSSDSEVSEEEKSKPRKRHRKVKGRGRSSALMLQELFGNPQRTEVAPPPKPSSGDMPNLDLNESTDSDTEDDSNTETIRNKSSTKNNKDSSADTLKVTAEPSKKIHPRSAPSLDIIDNIDLTPAKDQTKANLNIANKLQSDDKVTKSNAKGIKVTKGILNDTQKAPNQEEDIDIVTVAQQNIKSNQIGPVKTYMNKKKEIVSTEKDGTDSKDVSNTNTATEDEMNKTPKKASKIDKGDLETIKNKNTKDLSKESPNKGDPVLDKDESRITTPKKLKAPKRKSKPEMDANTSNSDPSDLPPPTKRKSQRIRNYTNPSATDEVSSDFTVGNSVSIKDAMKKLIIKKPEVKRGMKLRVKSSFMKLGILEIATDGKELINKPGPSNIKSGSKKK